MREIILKPEPLTRELFAPFGDVIETDGAHHYPINQGNTERFHDLANIDVEASNGRPLINIFRGKPMSLPFNVTGMERHPLGSQAFFPCSLVRFLVLVATADAEPTPDDLRLFITNGKQGVNYSRGTWHHYLLTLNEETDFVVIDRGGKEPNCDEIEFLASTKILIPEW
ncbi:MAG: ureidoglycolate lyase [Arenicellales bacterium WSBS_2016_MAG_OTU3]